jgi:hypothetical protein
MGYNGSVINHPRFNLEMVSHERRELALEESAVIADYVLFAGIQVIFLTHDCVQVIEHQNHHPSSTVGLVHLCLHYWSTHFIKISSSITIPID